MAEVNRSAAVVVFILVAPLLVLAVSLRLRPPRPPVLLVTLENVCASQPLPHADALRGLHFTQAATPAADTVRSVFTLFTSQWVSRLFGKSTAHPAIAPMPAWFKSQGYTTGAVSRLAPDLQAYPPGRAYLTLGEGFDDYLGGPSASLAQNWMAHHGGAWFLWVDLPQDPDAALGQVVAAAPKDCLIVVAGLGDARQGEAGMHVPLVMSWPDHLASREISGAVSNADVYPTLAQLLRRNPPRDAVGVDISGSFASRQLPMNEMPYAEGRSSNSR